MTAQPLRRRTATPAEPEHAGQFTTRQAAHHAGTARLTPRKSTRHRRYADAPPPASTSDRSRLPGPGRYAPTPTIPRQAPRQSRTRPPAHIGAPTRATASAQSRRTPRPTQHSSADRRRSYLANKHRILRETAGPTRALFCLWDELPYSCTMLAVMFLIHALDLLT
ncbi:hypothetical protein NOGI109294_18280 [Nocardiopsis gilva]